MPTPSPEPSGEKTMKSEQRILAQQFPVWTFIHEEMLERGWDKQELAIRMGGDSREVAINLLTLEFIEVVREPAAMLGTDTAERLASAFGVSKELFINLDNSYRLWKRMQIVPSDGETHGK